MMLQPRGVPVSALGFSFLVGWLAHQLAISLSMMHGAMASDIFTMGRAPLPTALFIPLGLTVALAPLCERLLSKTMTRADVYTVAASLFSAAAFMGLVLPAMLLFYQRALDDLMQGGVLDWDRLQEDYLLVAPAWRCRLGHLLMLLFFALGAFLQAEGFRSEGGGGLLPGWKES